MRLVTFERRIERDGSSSPTSMGDASLGFETLEEVPHGTQRLGALLDDGPHAGAVVDLNRALAIKLAVDDSGAPEAEADSLLPSDATRFLCGLPVSLDAAHTALSFTLDALDRYDAPDVLRAGVVEPLKHVRLRAPIRRPGKLIAADAANDGMRFVVLASSSVGDPGGEIEIPAGCEQLSFSGALAIAIGRECHRVTEQEALASIAGYACALDVRAGELGEIGRSCDGFTPIGPALVTADEVPDISGSSLQVMLSGEPVHEARLGETTLPPPELVARASRALRLEPGDLLLTGPGAGTDARWLRDGDVLEVEVAGLGRLRSYVRNAPAEPTTPSGT